MLPAVASIEYTSRRMLAYTIVLTLVTLLLVPVAGTGWIYGVSALVLGLVFIGSVVDLRRNPTPRRAMRVFGFSITYVTLLFSALAVDTLVRNGL